ncbi:MAG: 50S ribosomal protein L24 [Gemmatimonadota bacterium]|jgi:large subunit ribosomal protein L24|nr:50S ribosomal protein L24 [Gemmatimonadota bacterium]MDP6461352.1 50S ribosomal protein L24 [Gemmatimonadota bacterium]MDP6530045.1 50S ribosomal protein L24 [Gemmatimonadota bacterium]MDP6803408.1 50S ribosomal protein L24 [Gemmatimonadota bacterium]MDP7032383.1 50S ribosomal protein L24 [Gemmatimonadota bacterium]
MKIRRFDQVVVISGDDRGKTGKILRIFPDTERVIVEGVNFIKRHTRASATRQAGIIEREAPIHISNVMLLDPADGTPTRVGHQVLADGRKQRIARKSGEVAPEAER